MGIIAKRPIANVAWKGASMPKNAYGYSYRERLQTLQYDFLRDDLEQAVATALRFTLSVPGVDVAITGTSSLDNLRRNVAAATQGPLSQEPM